MKMADTRGRPLRDLRISITDRCNFRCSYCMPKEIFNREYEFLQRDSLLTFEEITRLTRVFREVGVGKVRITGGEPLLRKGIETLIAELAAIGLDDLTLTTNGSLLERKAEALAEAGLHRVTVSLDSLDPAVFAAMNDVDFPVADVLRGIDAAVAAGLTPVKINMVVKRGVNDDGILAMAEHFRGSGNIVRFIEFMDVGITNGWRLDDVVSAQQILDTVSAKYPIQPIPANYLGEVATRWEYEDGQGEIGVIASISKPFCGGCTRARLSAEGVLYTCLFATSGVDFRGPLRSGASDDDLRQMIVDIWEARTDRYSELRSGATVNLPRVEMSYIGG
jgi:cyclic pyranopterin phosphate synthase